MLASSLYAAVMRTYPSSHGFVLGCAKPTSWARAVGMWFIMSAGGCRCLPPLCWCSQRKVFAKAFLPGFEDIQSATFQPTVLKYGVRRPRHLGGELIWTCRLQSDTGVRHVEYFFGEFIP